MSRKRGGSGERCWRNARGIRKRFGICVRFVAVGFGFGFGLRLRLRLRLRLGLRLGVGTMKRGDLMDVSQDLYLDPM